MIYSEPIGDQWKYNPEYNRVAEFLGIDRKAREGIDVVKKIAFLRDHFDPKEKVKDVSVILESFEKMRKSSGLNTQGETLLNELYQRARLESDRKQSITPKVEDVPKDHKQAVESKKVVKTEEPTPAKEPSVMQRMIQEAVSKSVSQTISSAVKESLT